MSNHWSSPAQETDILHAPVLKSSPLFLATFDPIPHPRFSNSVFSEMPLWKRFYARGRTSNCRDVWFSRWAAVGVGDREKVSIYNQQQTKCAMSVRHLHW